MPDKNDLKAAKQSARSKAGKPAKKGGYGDHRFINFNVTEDMKRRAAIFLEGETDVWRYVEELVGSGYRVAVGWDGYNNAYSCSITNKDGDTAFRNATITLRAGTAWDAVCRGVAIHFAVSGGDWTNLEHPDNSGDVW